MFKRKSLDELIMEYREYCPTAYCEYFDNGTLFFYSVVDGYPERFSSEKELKKYLKRKIKKIKRHSLKKDCLYPFSDECFVESHKKGFNEK